jgi:hypothetical protein
MPKGPRGDERFADVIGAARAAGAQRSTRRCRPTEHHIRHSDSSLSLRREPIGRGQQAPLTPEYQAIFEASLADQALGGAGNDPRYACLPVGMPRLMSVIFPMELIFTPKTTYILFENNMPRRIYTNGRGWPDHPEPSELGVSQGRSE